MRITCRHGFFTFEEMQVGDASVFMADTGLVLVPYRNGYTFEGLEKAPDFSLKGFDYLGFEANTNFEGEPWEIFEANECVFDFTTNKVVSINSIIGQSTIEAALNRFYASGMIKAGTVDQNGGNIKGYSLYYSESLPKYLYSVVSYV